MAKVKKISINALERVMKDNYEPTISIEWCGLEITIKKTLSLTEVIKFVEDVAETCFAEGTNDYIPEVIDFAIKSNVLEMYTNLSLPKSNDARYALIYQTDVFDEIIKYINTVQFDEMRDSINEKLKYRSSNLLAKFNEQINDVLGSVEELGNNISNIFEGIDKETIANIAQALANGNFDEQKFIESDMKATYSAPDNDDTPQLSLVGFHEGE